MERPLAPAPLEAPDAARPRVFDAHLHVEPWHQLREPVRQAWRAANPRFRELESLGREPERLLGLMDEFGIDRAAVITYPAPEVMGFDDQTMDLAIRLAAIDRRRIAAIGGVDLRRHPRPGQLVERLHGSGVAGLKIHPPHQAVAANAYLDGGHPGLAEFYATAQRLRLPVMIHTGTSTFPGARNRFADPMACDDVAVDYPELAIILAHAGRPLFGDTATFLARRHRNVHLDLSGIPPKRLPGFLPRLEEIADKCLWGTDWPGPGVPDPGHNVIDFLRLELPAAARASILWDNACRIFPET